MQQYDMRLLLQRVDNLESKLAFQEITIEDLNRIIIQHQSELSSLRGMISHLVERIQSASDSAVAPLSEETLPPHY